VRPRGGWGVLTGLLVGLSLVGLVSSGCEKTGGGKAAEQAPPSPTEPTTPPPSPTPTPSPPTVVGITLTAGSSSLIADGASSTTITAQLLTSTGAPAADGTVVTFTTDLGRFDTSGAKSISATTSQGTSSVTVPFISEPGVVGTATVVATAEGIPQSLTIDFVAAVPPPTPPPTVAGITMEAGVDSLVANGTSSTLIAAILISTSGTPVPDGVTVNFLTDLGRFTTDGAKTATATTSGGTGTALVPFISEQNVIGTATIVANVAAVAQSLQIALTGAGAPARIILSADSTTISIAGTTGISAQVLDADGNNVADGTAVNFATNVAGTGVTPVVTTTNGVATAIFSAGTKSGVATITATANSASAAISITIQAGDPGSLEFVSADPTLIGVRGSALPQKSTITFRVRDQNGNPVDDGTLVTFTLISGLGGGEFISPTTAGTLAGLVSTVLTSGTVAGPVRILASVTVGTTTLTSSSTNVSITGGPPSGAHIGVAPAFRNIAGLVTQGIICPLTAIVGDRFGNPVPQNTAVSFFTNGGVVTAQGLTDELGNAPSQIKTGPPTPRVGSTPDPNIVDPRTGLVTVIAVTQGEETFIDSNGNGLFDGPQEFDPNDPEIDTPEPFIDQVTLCNGQPFPAPCAANPVNPPVLSGDGEFDPSNRFELFIDGNGDGIWNTPNGFWDANKPIFASTRVLFSGPTRLRIGRLTIAGTCCIPDGQPCDPPAVNNSTLRADPECPNAPADDPTGNPNNFCVPQGGSADRGPFCFLVSDPAGRPLVSGSSLRVTTSSGTISGTNSLTLPDVLEGGPGITFFSFTVVDADATDEDPPEAAAVNVTVTSPQTVTCPGGNGNVDGPFGGLVQ